MDKDAIRLKNCIADHYSFMSKYDGVNTDLFTVEEEGIVLKEPGKEAYSVYWIRDENGDTVHIAKGKDIVVRGEKYECAYCGNERNGPLDQRMIFKKLVD